MNQEMTSKLYNDFPELFRGKDKSMLETAMCFGFDCDDGWFDIIYQLSADIMTLAKKAGIEPPEAVQVKEKFGGLRFYVTATAKEIHERIHEAEEASYCICEVCGKAGKVRRGGWIRTLCEEHFEG